MKDLWFALPLVLIAGCQVVTKNRVNPDESLRKAPEASVSPGWASYQSEGFSIALPGEWEVREHPGHKLISAVDLKFGDPNMRALSRNQVETAAPENAKGLVAIGAGAAGQLEANIVFAAEVGRIDSIEKAVEDFKANYASDPMIDGQAVVDVIDLPAGKFAHLIVRYKDSTGQPGQVREEYIGFDSERRFGAIFFGMGTDLVGHQMMETFRIRSR